MTSFIRWLAGRPPAAPAPPASGYPATHDASALVARGPAPVTLYDQAGEAVQVDAERVAAWLAKGFRLTRVDLAQEVADLEPRFRATHLALAALVAEATHAEELSPAALATAQAGVTDLAEAIAGILTSAQLAYRVAEPEPVAMRDADGAPHRIDPNQVAYYRGLGYTEVAA